MNNGLLVVKKDGVILKPIKELVMDDIIEELKQKPNLKLLVTELNQLIEKEEIERNHFYQEITETDKAEFINGEIIMHSPVKAEHADASGGLYSLMRYYAIKHDSGKVFTEKVMIHLTRNSYEPDIAFFKKEKAMEFVPKQMLFPAPDLIVEVLSPSTEKNDRGIKFIDYANHGVEEYWLIDTEHQSIEQYILQENGKYELEYKSKTGSVSSQALTGFTITVRAIFNEEENAKALQQILQS